MTELDQAPASNPNAKQTGVAVEHQVDWRQAFVRGNNPDAASKEQPAAGPSPQASQAESTPGAAKQPAPQGPPSASAAKTKIDFGGKIGAVEVESGPMADALKSINEEISFRRQSEAKALHDLAQSKQAKPGETLETNGNKPPDAPSVSANSKEIAQKLHKAMMADDHDGVASIVEQIEARAEKRSESKITALQSKLDEAMSLMQPALEPFQKRAAMKGARSFLESEFGAKDLTEEQIETIFDKGQEHFDRMYGDQKLEGAAARIAGTNAFQRAYFDFQQNGKTPGRDEKTGQFVPAPSRSSPGTPAPTEKKVESPQSDRLGRVNLNTLYK